MSDIEVINHIDSLTKWEKFNVYLNYLALNTKLKCSPTILPKYKYIENKETITKETIMYHGWGEPTISTEAHLVYFYDYNTYTFEDFIESNPYTRKEITYCDLVGIYGFYKKHEK
jgi:hypothetical protein